MLSTKSADTRYPVAMQFCSPLPHFWVRYSIAPQRRVPNLGSPCWSSPRPPAFATIRSRKDCGDRGAGGRERFCGGDHGKTPRGSATRSWQRYKVVVFLNTTGDVLDTGEKAASERYIRSGGGFVGIHSASDTEYGWPWYGRLVGTWFASHRQTQRATIHIANLDHPSTKGLPAERERTDEWYNFRSNPRGAVQVLATLDEATYSGGAMGADHPITWCQAIDGGRSWYTAMGHTKESYDEPLFRLHLLGGIEGAAGVAGSCKG